MATTTYVPRLKSKYKDDIRTALKDKFQYKSVMQVPKLEKIAINQGVGGATTDKKLIENTINELQIEIDDRVVQLLALQQLMATDLRFVLAIARINNDLERIGDQAVNIAHSATRIVRHPRVKPYVDLPRMGELAEKMMRDSLDSLVRRDIELARSVLSRDDQVDQLRDQIFRELLSYMMGDSSVVFPAFELILVAKNLERIADHATNVAEDVIYMVAGSDVRHSTADRHTA